MGEVKHTDRVCVQEIWCSRLQATAEKQQCGQTLAQEKDSRDLSDWATDLLPSLLPTPVSFSKANSSLDLLLCTLSGSNVILGRACGKEALGVTWCQRLGRCTLPLCPRRLLDLPAPSLLSPTFPPSSHPPSFVPPPTGDQPFIHN